MIKKTIKFLREKFISVAGSVSGITSFLGSYQVCHNLCMSVIALLSILGITVVGMPFLFLTKVAIPFWIAAVILFLITLWIYIRKKCISTKIIIFNFGLIIIGIPFQSFQKYSLISWSIGGVLIILTFVLYFRDKLSRVKLDKNKGII